MGYIWFHAFLKGINAMWNATTSSKIWTRVVVIISHDDKHFATDVDWLIFFFFKTSLVDVNKFKFAHKLF